MRFLIRFDKDFTEALFFEEVHSGKIALTKDRVKDGYVFFVDGRIAESGNEKES